LARTAFHPLTKKIASKKRDGTMQLIDTRFGLKTPVVTTFKHYASGSLALLLSTEEGEPWSVASVAVPGYTPPEGAICIKNWSENEGMEDLLLRAGVIVGAPLTHIPSGHVQIPVYRLSEQALAEAEAVA
jgi:hypothetical protein